MICKYFLPCSGLPFHFVDCFLGYVAALQFNVVPLAYFSFVAFAYSTNMYWAPDTHCPMWSSANSLVASWLHWTSSTMEGTALALTGIDLHSVWRLAFPAYNVPVNTTLQRLTRCLIQHHGTLPSMASDQGTHVRENEVRQWVLLIEPTDLTCCPTS